MKPPLLLVGVALFAGLAIWWLRDEPAHAPPRVEPAATPEAPADGEDSQAAASERHAIVAPTAEAAPDGAPKPTEEPTFAVAPWLARFLVVDEDDAAVADATVTLWAAKRAGRSHVLQKVIGSTGRSYSGRIDPALLELRTDANGRTQTTLVIECGFAEARKESIGRSGELTLWNTRSVEGEIVLRLETLRTLRGIVIRADGSPASGARVTATLNGGSAGRPSKPTVPEPVTAGADGRFALTVQKLAGYDLQAELDGAKSFRDSVWVMAEPPEVTLLFPGGITLVGIVVDSEGQPVADAQVCSWRELQVQPLARARGGDADERGYARTSGDGRFSIAVRKHARYHLIANKKGQANSKLLSVETTAVRPHVDTRLQLPSFATIRGRVERDDGSAWAGAIVFVLPEDGEPMPRRDMPTQEDLFPSVASVTTGADGAFELTVHPETKWTVVALPTAARHPRVQQSGVAPGSEGVVLRFTAADLEGCVVHGTVVRADGEPVGDYQVRLFEWENNKPPWKSADAKAVIDGDRFTVPALSRGKQYSLWVTLSGSPFGPAAPVQVGPFVTDQKELSLEFRLPLWGEVTVRVLDASGAPPRKVRVGMQALVPLGFPEPGLLVGTDGSAVLKRCLPGANTLRVSRDGALLSEQALHVVPGLNADVVVHLPAK